MNVDVDNLVLVKRAVEQTPYANETPSKTHVRVRCPICGDSHKTFNSTHCYINIEYGKPISYYCFLCNNGGYVNSTFMRSLHIFNINAISAMNRYNSPFRRNRKVWMSRGHVVSYKERSYVPVLKRSINYQYKVDYINDRLGINLDYQLCSDMKIVLSLKEFLNFNSIDLNPRMYEFAQSIESDYVGVLSARGEYISFRNTKKNKNKRYIIYPIFKNNEESNKFYIIPNELDIMSNDINLHIAEGYFDTLSCYFNICNQEKTNSIYAAVCGSGFLNCLKYIMQMGFIDNLNINIYADKDKPIYYFQDTIVDTKELCKSLNIFYNSYDGEKDIGIIKDKIKLQKVKIRR